MSLGHGTPRPERREGGPPLANAPTQACRPSIPRNDHLRPPHLLPHFSRFFDNSHSPPHAGEGWQDVKLRPAESRGDRRTVNPALPKGRCYRPAGTARNPGHSRVRRLSANPAAFRSETRLSSFSGRPLDRLTHASSQPADKRKPNQDQQKRYQGRARVKSSTRPRPCLHSPPGNAKLQPGLSLASTKRSQSPPRSRDETKPIALDSRSETNPIAGHPAPSNPFPPPPQRPLRGGGVYDDA